MTDATTLDQLPLTAESDLGVNVDRSGRARRHIRFSLDLMKPVEEWLYTQIMDMTAVRMFQPVIRDALRLWLDLSRGRIDVLLELFPDVKSHPDFAGHEPSEKLQQQLDRLERLILDRGVQISPRSPLPPPEDGDTVELEIRQAGRDENNNSTYNFLIASALNIYGNYDGLAPEIVEYGLRTGRIRPNKTGNGNPKAMDVPQFDVPNFDEIEI